MKRPLGTPCSIFTDMHNTNGSAGTKTNATFNKDSSDPVAIAINWEDDGAINEHSCVASLSMIVDGCDVPNEDTGANAENLKHGGSIVYYSDSVNATFSIEPLVMRREWSGGKASDPECSDEKFYHVERSTLKTNIEDYCEGIESYSNGTAEAGSTYSQDYNEDSSDRVTIEVEWPEGQREYMIFEDECKYYMGILQ